MTVLHWSLLWKSVNIQAKDLIFLFFANGKQTNFFLFCNPTKQMSNDESVPIIKFEQIFQISSVFSRPFYFSLPNNVVYCFPRCFSFEGFHAVGLFFLFIFNSCFLYLTVCSVCVMTLRPPLPVTVGSPSHCQTFVVFFVFFTQQVLCGLHMFFYYILNTRNSFLRFPYWLESNSELSVNDLSLLAMASSHEDVSVFPQSLTKCVRWNESTILK